MVWDFLPLRTVSSRSRAGSVVDGWFYQSLLVSLFRRRNPSPAFQAAPVYTVERPKLLP
jgi:hypothetical protein